MKQMMGSVSVHLWSFVLGFDSSHRLTKVFIPKENVKILCFGQSIFLIRDKTMGLLFDAAMAWDKLSNAAYDIDVAKNRKVHHIKLSFLREDFRILSECTTQRMWILVSMRMNIMVTS